MNRTFVVSRPRPFSWLDLLIVVLGIAGVIAFFALYERAMPDAAVDVSISRQQAEDIAREALHDFGHSVDGYQFALSFSSDDFASFYLQRTLGIEDTNQRMAAEDWPLYYWSARWFKPLQKEEFRVYLTPDGRILGLNHILEETAAGADLPQEQARAIAETFLAQNTDWASADWEAVEASSVTLPGGRSDHTFTWKSRHYSAGDSELRRTVVVRGDQVGYAFTSIKVPEAFQREYATERNNAGFIDTIAFFVGIFGFLLASVIPLAYVRYDARRAIFPVLLAAGVVLASYLNLIPLMPSSYDTTENYVTFWLMNALGILLASFFYALLIYIAWLGGQAISKFVWPREDKFWARGPMHWVTFSCSALRGLFLGGAHLGYVAVFYIFTHSMLGWWSPVMSGYNDLFGTPFPFFSAYELGLIAALSEELLFRLIGIAAFLWLLRGKHTWLALLIPALFWSFAHTGYVSYPIYARGVELTIVALLYGLIFLKFDLVTTLMSHFTYNMMLMGCVLLRSSESYYQFSGWIVVATLALPLLPGLLWTLRRTLHKEPPLPETLTLTPTAEADLPQLSALPVKADWPTLLGQSNRSTFCLKAGEQMIGFVTGFVRDGHGWVDGVYIVRAWRRQYWAATLLGAMRDYYQGFGVKEMRAAIPSRDQQSQTFFSSQFWRKQAFLVGPVEKPSLGEALKEMVDETFKKKEAGEFELEIPQDVL